MITNPTFIIGLGGVGNAVVRLIRERFLSSESGEIPPTVFLRSIDTADQSEQATQADRLPPSMYTRLGHFSAAQVIARPDLYPHVQRWWRYPENAYAAAYIDNGAGARRPVGRLCFFQQFSQVHDGLLADFRNALSVDLQNRLSAAGLGKVQRTPRVYIVGSLAGGTGAGMFIDVALLSRHLLERAGYDLAATKITGIFALPSVIHLASGDGQASMGRQRRVNAAAALRELDFLMNRRGSQPIVVEYPSPIGRLENTLGLYNQVYLFTDTKQGGHMFSRENDVLLRTAHFLFGQVSLGTGDQTVLIMDNYSQYLDPSQQRVADGLAAIYGSFGVEWLEVPRKQLLDAWCREIGDRVGGLVADFEWDREPRQDLAKAVRARMTEQQGGYLAAFRLLEIDPQGVTTIPELADAQVLLQPISEANKRQELSRALSDFEVGVQTLIQKVRRSARPIPASRPEDDWIVETAQALLSESAFRLGGAKRVLRKAGEMLNAVASAGEGQDPSVDDVMGDCRRGILGRIDPGPALEWARRRLHRQSLLAVRNEIGADAARFAQKCLRMAEILETMQHTVRDEGSRIGGTTGEQVGADLPPEAWLLDPGAVDKVIRENLDGVSREVADRVAKGMSQELGRFEAFDQVAGQAKLAALFRRFVVEAIELAAVRRTTRPADTLARIKGRMEACQPLAHMVEDGIEYREVMSTSRTPASMKLVVTGMAGQERSQLESWEREEATKAGESYHFQIIASDDPLRDDALHLSFGWPLCLFREVQACEKAFQEAKTADSHSTTFAYTMREIAGIDEHVIMPKDSRTVRQLFAVALTLGAIRLSANLSQVIFGPEVAGREDAVDVARDSVVRDGLDRFRKYGYVSGCESWLNASLKDAEAARKMKGKIQEEVATRRSALEDLRANEQVPANLVSDLSELYKLADDWSRRIVLV